MSSPKQVHPSFLKIDLIVFLDFLPRVSKLHHTIGSDELYGQNRGKGQAQDVGEPEVNRLGDSQIVKA